MSVLDFIFGIIVVIILSLTILMSFALKTEALKLSEENEKLKKKLKNREYKEAQIVKEKKKK